MVELILKVNWDRVFNVYNIVLKGRVSYADKKEYNPAVMEH